MSSYLTDISYKIPGVGSVLELFDIRKTYNAEKEKIENASKNLKYIQKELEKKQSSNFSHSSSRTRPLTTQEKTVLSQKVDQLSKRLDEKKEELISVREQALIKTGGVLLQESLNNVVPGSGPVVAGALKAVNVGLYGTESEEEEKGEASEEESYTRAPGILRRAVSESAKDALLSSVTDAVVENSCSIM